MSVQDCLTAMHEHGFKIVPPVKEAFRALRKQAAATAAAGGGQGGKGESSEETALAEYILRSDR